MGIVSEVGPSSRPAHQPGRFVVRSCRGLRRLEGAQPYSRLPEPKNQTLECITIYNRKLNAYIYIYKRWKERKKETFLEVRMKWELIITVGDGGFRRPMSPNASVGRLDSAGVVRPWMPLKDENVSEYVSEKHDRRKKKRREEKRGSNLEA